MSREEAAPRPSTGELWSSPGKEEEPARGTVRESRGALDTREGPVLGRKSDPPGPVLYIQWKKEMGARTEQTW